MEDVGTRVCTSGAGMEDGGYGYQGRGYQTYGYQGWRIQVPRAEDVDPAQRKHIWSWPPV